MPIKQERLLALVGIADEALSARDRIKEITKNVLSDALDAFYSSDETERNNLAQILIASIQSIDSALSMPFLSETSLVALITEREHFRLRRAHNARAKKAMEKKRQNNRRTVTDLQI